jgi:hypothetical protein
MPKKFSGSFQGKIAFTVQIEAGSKEEADAIFERMNFEREDVPIFIYDWNDWDYYTCYEREQADE